MEKGGLTRNQCDFTTEEDYIDSLYIYIWKINCLSGTGLSVARPEFASPFPNSFLVTTAA